MFDIDNQLKRTPIQRQCISDLQRCNSSLNQCISNLQRCNSSLKPLPSIREMQCWVKKSFISKIFLEISKAPDLGCDLVWKVAVGRFIRHCKRICLRDDRCPPSYHLTIYHLTIYHLSSYCLTILPFTILPSTILLSYLSTILPFTIYHLPFYHLFLKIEMTDSVELAPLS